MSLTQNATNELYALNNTRNIMKLSSDYVFAMTLKRKFSKKVFRLTYVKC